MSRTHGLSADDLLQNPVLIAEHLERGEIRCERDLIIDDCSEVFNTVTFDASVNGTQLNSSLDDFYNGAILVNVTRNARYAVTDYSGSIKTLVLTSVPHEWVAGDKCYLKNIGGAYDTTVIDAAASDRSLWVFDRSITQSQVSQEIFQQLMFESHCIRFKSFNRTNIVSLDLDEYADTLTTPFNEGGKSTVWWEFTPFNNIYSDFELNYDFDYAQNIYRKTARVNKNSCTDVYLNQMKTYCAYAEEEYKIGRRKYSYNSDWIHDDATAYYFLEKLVLWFSYQRMILHWTGDIEHHIKYEVGDKLKVDYPYMIPEGRNNQQIFMVTYKRIQPKKKVVQLNLLY
jgi:hypothetical protein